MELHHRKALQENLIALKESVDLQRLYPYLINEGVIDDEDVNNLKRKFPDREDQATEFFLWYTKRGPKAYQALIRSLKSCKYARQYKLLQSYNDEGKSDPNEEVRVRNQSGGSEVASEENEEFMDIRASYHLSKETILEDKEYLKIHVRPATVYNCGVDDAYRMHSRPRGFALIINNITFQDSHILYRAGAEVDTINLKHLLEAFGFDVMACENVQKIHVRDIMERFVEQFKHKAVDACFVALMSHGYENYIQMSDPINATIDVWDDVVTRFNNKHCRVLMGKPKIFLIQACRGSMIDKGVSRTETDLGVATPGPEEYMISPDKVLHQIQPPAALRLQPEFKDILVCYATTPGFVSNRDVISGSWYIRTLCEIFMDGAYNTEIKKLLDKVGRKMEEIISEVGTKQMSSYSSFGFNHDFFFNPGLYENTKQAC